MVVCLVCGTPAMSGDRRVIGNSGQNRDLTNLWKKIATIELEKREEIQDVEVVLQNRRFKCRKCYRAYGNFITDKKVIFIQDITLSNN